METPDWRGLRRLTSGDAQPLLLGSHDICGERGSRRHSPLTLHADQEYPRTRGYRVLTLPPSSTHSLTHHSPITQKLTMAGFAGLNTGNNLSLYAVPAAFGLA